MRFKTALRLVVGMALLPLGHLYADGCDPSSPYPGAGFHHLWPSYPPGRFAIAPAPFLAQGFPGTVYAPSLRPPRWNESAGRYRFRPRREGGTLRRPVQPRYLPPVTIADHYRFRPLNPAKRRFPAPRPTYGWPPAPPVVPPLRRGPVYGGFPPVMPGPRWRGRPFYAGGLSGREGRYGGALAGTVPQSPYRRPVEPPRLSKRPYPGRRFRPPAPRHGMPPFRYARFNPGGWGMPPFAYGMPASARYREGGPLTPWGPGCRRPGKAVYRPLQAPSGIKRYGVDWYDGRGDEAGAWYKLATESWPAVSRHRGNPPLTPGPVDTNPIRVDGP